MKIYFLSDKTIAPEHSVLFNQIALNIHESYIEFIELISKEHGRNIDWWVCGPASKNTLASPLFHYCCCFVLLKEFIYKKEPISEIITDSKASKKIVEDYLTNQGVNTRVTLIQKPVKERIREFRRLLFFSIGIHLEHLFLFIIAKKTRSRRKMLPTDPVILIDTFIMQDYIEKDRYYPGILEALSKKEKQSVWFVPALYGFQPWQYLSVIKQLCKSERNFVLVDDYLRFHDYFFAWNHIFRIRKLKLKSCIFQGVDVSLLVHEEMMSLREFGSSYMALLNYRFAERLKQENVKLKLIIDWFENQIIDRGWNAGFRYFFPKTVTKGYQGFFASTHYLCMYPTVEEKKNAVIPHEILVVGRGLVRSARKYCPNLNVNVAPALRFQHVWQKRKLYPDAKLYTILVALPINLSDAIYNISLLIQVKKKLNNNIRFVIKPHPTTSLSQMKKALLIEGSEQFEFIGGNFNEMIEKSNLLISNASSTCLETLAKGIPVIVLGNRYGLTQNPIPENINEDIWCLCYTPEEVVKAIKLYQSMEVFNIAEFERIGQKIREEYFEPTTQGNIRNFLMYNNKLY